MQHFYANDAPIFPPPCPKVNLKPNISVMHVTVEISDNAVTRYLSHLSAKIGNPRPLLADMGECMLARVKDRFDSSVAPDGTPWAANSPVTISCYLGKYGGSWKKDGTLSKKGRARASGKKPLIGESKTLSSQFYTRTGADCVELGNSTIYAAVHQFGARRGQFGTNRRGNPIPWGDIPARPFLPITKTGELDPGEERALLDVLEDYLQRALDM